MNRKHQDPFKTIELPEVIEEYLDYGVAKCCAFNRRGTLLATGCEDGYIVIWDSATRGVVKVLPGHSLDSADDQQQQQQRRAALAAPTVTSLAWSRNGRYLLSGALDKRVIMWEVLTGQKVFEISVASGVRHVSLSPKKPYKAVASLLSTPPVIIDMALQEVTPLASIDFKSSAGGQQEMVLNTTADGFALLSTSGREVLLGQMRGTITIYDTDTHQVMDVVRLPATGAKVISMSLNRQGTFLLANCSDKAIRMYDVKQRRPDAPMYSREQLSQALSRVESGQVGSLLHSPEDCMLKLSPNTFHNAVEKQQWKGAVFSGDSEHVVGAVAGKSDHRIYIWERLSGKLERILEGPRTETLADLVWHPTESQLVTTSGNGRLYIWAQVYNENWSAFAPEFQELDENEEYVEQEDEFDINEKPILPSAGGEADAEDEEVDVVTRERMLVFSSDEEDEQQDSEEPLYWLPAEVNLQAPGAAKDAEQGRRDQQEGSDESSDEDDGKGEQTEDLILDRPRDRKRRVRFEDSYDEGDDEDDDEDDYPAAAGRGGRTGSRGRGGRRGRPPRAPGAGAAPGRGAYSTTGYPGGGMFSGGGPGNALNPPPLPQQQQQMAGVFGQLPMMPGSLQHWQGR